MAKAQTKYICGACSHISVTQVGRCPSCGAWGTMEPQVTRAASSALPLCVAPKPVGVVDAPREERIRSGIEEFDRVLGGGWLCGGVALLGGEPGVGKSTLLLQSCAAMSLTQKILYVSGEESASQLASRAKRLKLAHGCLEFLCTENIAGAISAAKDYAMVVFDSVQALKDEEQGGWPGSPAQVRAVAEQVINFSKTTNIPSVLVGHITKQGQIAGPKLLEHLVDVVLLFWGERASSARILRAEKNRFGSTEELGVFEMTEGGLMPMSDLSHLYWSSQGKNAASISGVAMGVCLEGTRPLITEVQALSAKTPFPYPKRTSRGIEANKLHLLLAVLERRCDMSARSSDVYVNVAGGLNVSDTAVDLPVCMALASAITDKPLSALTCFIGEVGLGGEIRPCQRAGVRIKEAARLGFKQIIMNCRSLAKTDKADKKNNYGIEIIDVESLKEAISLFF